MRGTCSGRRLASSPTIKYFPKWVAVACLHRTLSGAFRQPVNGSWSQQRDASRTCRSQIGGGLRSLEISGITFACRRQRSRHRSGTRRSGSLGLSWPCRLPGRDKCRPGCRGRTQMPPAAGRVAKSGDRPDSSFRRPDGIRHVPDAPELTPSRTIGATAAVQPRGPDDQRSGVSQSGIKSCWTCAISASSRPGGRNLDVAKPRAAWQGHRATHGCVLRISCLRRGQVIQAWFNLSGLPECPDRDLHADCDEQGWADTLSSSTSVRRGAAMPSRHVTIGGCSADRVGGGTQRADITAW